MFPWPVEPSRRSQLSPRAWSLLRPLRALPHGPSFAQGWGWGGVQRQLSCSPVQFSPASRNSASSPRSIMGFATDLHFLCALSSDVYKQWTAGKALEGGWLCGEEVGRGVRGNPCCCDHHLSHNLHQEGPEHQRTLHRTFQKHQEFCPGQSW